MREPPTTRTRFSVILLYSANVIHLWLLLSILHTQLGNHPLRSQGLSSFFLVTDVVPLWLFPPHRSIGHVVQGESRKGRLSFVVVVCLFVCFCISALLCDCRVFFRSLEWRCTCFCRPAPYYNPRRRHDFLLTDLQRSKCPGLLTCLLAKIAGNLAIVYLAISGRDAGLLLWL